MKVDLPLSKTTLSTLATITEEVVRSNYLDTLAAAYAKLEKAPISADAKARVLGDVVTIYERAGRAYNEQARREKPAHEL